MNRDDSKIHVVCKAGHCDARAYAEVQRQTSLEVLKMRADSTVSIPRHDVIIVFDGSDAVSRLHRQYPENQIVAIVPDESQFASVRRDANLVFDFNTTIKSRFKWKENITNKNKVAFS